MSNSECAPMQGPHNAVGWFEIYVQDIQRAKTFYESVFQTTLEPLMSDETMQLLAFPMQEGAMGITGALVQMQGMPSGGNSTIIYFITNDCAVEAERVTSAGGQVFKEKLSIGEYGFIALVVDTEGNTIGLHSMV